MVLAPTRVFEAFFLIRVEISPFVGRLSVIVPASSPRRSRNSALCFGPLRPAADPAASGSGKVTND
jgi:hypothetical protein